MPLLSYLLKVGCFTSLSLHCGCWVVVSICLWVLVGKSKCPVGYISFSVILPSTIIFLCLCISQSPNVFVLCSWITGPQGWTYSHSECGYQDWLWYWGWQTGSDVQRVYPAKRKPSAGWKPVTAPFLLAGYHTHLFISCCFQGLSLFWWLCPSHSALPIVVKFQKDLIVYNEYLFMSRNIDLNYLKCFRKGSVILNLSQSSSLELWIPCWLFSFGGLLPHVYVHNPLRILLYPLIPSLKGISYTSILLLILYDLCISYWHQTS